MSFFKPSSSQKPGEGAPAWGVSDPLRRLFLSGLCLGIALGIPIGRLVDRLVAG